MSGAIKKERMIKMLNVSKLIKELRTEKGLTQQAFADLIGVTQSTLCKWENETRGVDIDSLSQILKTSGLQLAIEEMKPELSKELQLAIEETESELSEELPWIKDHQISDPSEIFDNVHHTGGGVFLNEKLYQTPQGTLMALFSNLKGGIIPVTDSTGNPFNVDLEDEENWMFYEVYPLIHGVYEPFNEEGERYWKEEDVLNIPWCERDFITSPVFQSLPEDIQLDMKTRLVQYLNWEEYHCYQTYFGYLDSEGHLHRFDHE